MAMSKTLIVKSLTCYRTSPARLSSQSRFLGLPLMRMNWGPEYRTRQRISLTLCCLRSKE
jgi:hypothetical protein